MVIVMVVIVRVMMWEEMKGESGCPSLPPSLTGCSSVATRSKARSPSPHTGPGGRCPWRSPAGRGEGRRGDGHRRVAG